MNEKGLSADSIARMVYLGVQKDVIMDFIEDENVLEMINGKFQSLLTASQRTKNKEEWMTYIKDVYSKVAI